MSHWGFLEPYIRAWRKSLNGDISTTKSRIHAYLDMLFIDHGLFRYFYANRFRVSAQVVRQNHPPPLMIARAARRGVRTVINLRGDTGFGSDLLSREACRRHGLTLVDFKVYSRKAPDRELILGAKKLFEQAEYPILLHCKSGADRAGLMAALYLILHEGRSVAEAKKQLHWLYGHIRLTKTGIMDYFFETYEAANAKQPITFLDWVQNEYDAEALGKSFKVNRWGILLDRIMNRE